MLLRQILEDSERDKERIREIEESHKRGEISTKERDDRINAIKTQAHDHFLKLLYR